MKYIVTLFFMLFALCVNAQYKPGDYYDNGNLKGIVIRVDASGEHGLIMSLDRCAKKWLQDKERKFETNAFFEDDGQKNMEIIARYIQEHNLSWADFPFFEWCRSYGEGWYAPALDELIDILKMINGNSGKKKKNIWKIKYDAKCIESVSKLIEQKGGESLYKVNPFWMFSSTEADAGKVYTLYFKESTSSMFGGGMTISAKSMKGKWIVEPKSKTTADSHFAKWHGSRAVHKF